MSATFERLLQMVHHQTLNFKLNTILSCDLFTTFLILCPQFLKKWKTFQILLNEPAADILWKSNSLCFTTKSLLKIFGRNSIFPVFWKYLAYIFSHYAIHEEELEFFEWVNSYCKYNLTREFITLEQCLSKHLSLHELMALFE